MKKKFGIFLAVMIMVTCLVSLFAIIAIAEENQEEQDTITISYMATQDTTSDTTSLDKTAYEGGKQVVGKGEKFTLPTTSSNTYAGQDGFQLVWYTENGRTYKAGEEVSFDKDTKLFRCVAKECYTMAEVNYAMTNESKSAILMADIDANSSISVENQGQSVLILNGFTMTLTKNSSGFMGSQRSGKHIYGEGTINAVNPDGKLGSYYFFQDQSHGYNGSANKTVVGVDVTINAPTMWLGADSDGSYNNHYPWTRIYGSINCYGLLSITNANNRAPFVEIFDSATVTVNGPSLFWDVASSKFNNQSFELRIYGGTFNLPAEAANVGFWSNDTLEGVISLDGKTTYPNKGLDQNTKDNIKIFGGTFNVEGGAAPGIASFFENEYLGSIPSGGDGLLAKKNTSTYHVAYMNRPGYKLAFDKYATEGTPAKLVVTDYVDGSLSGTYYYIFTTITLEGATSATVDTITVYEDAEGTIVTDKFKLDFGMAAAVLFSNAITQKEYKLQANEGAYVVVPAGCEHNYEKTVVEASCQAQGSETITCTLCGHSTTTIIDQKTEHNWELTSHTEATLTALGAKSYKCADCGETVEKAYSLDPTSLEIAVKIRNDDGTFEETTVLASEIFDFTTAGTNGDYIYTLSAIKAFGDYKIRNIYGITIPQGILYINITTQNYEKYSNVEYGVAELNIAEGASVYVQNIGNLRKVEKITVGKNADVIFGLSCSYYNPSNERRNMQKIATIDLSAGNHNVKFMGSAFSERTTVAVLLLGENSTYNFGSYSFNKCAITEFDFPTSNEYTFGSYCFYGNDMTELVFHDNFDMTFGQSVFENCPNLASVKFGKNSTYSIGNYCFMHSVLDTVVFAPNSNYTVGAQAFMNNLLTTIDASAGNMTLTLNNNAFNCWFKYNGKDADNANITSIKLGPNSTYYFAKESFARTDIETLTLAANSEYSFIEYCFNNVPNLTKIDASAEGITALWSGNAFRDRTTLASIEFGKNGNHTFNGSSFYKTAITELVLAENSTYVFNEGCFSSASIAKIDASASGLNVTFKYRAFRDRTTLTELLINGENSIYDFANESFYNTKLTTLTFGEGSTYTFSSYPFSNTNIVSVDGTASNVTATFNGSTFSGKTSLEYVAFGENSTYVIGDSAFNGTNPKNDIVFSSTSTFTIGKESFKQTDFASVTFEDNCNVTFKGTNAFNECTAKELYIGKNIAVTNYPFKNFKYLEKLTIMDGVTHASEYEFENAGSADFATPLVVYNHSNELTFTKGMFNNCDGITLYTVTDNIGTRTDVFSNCGDTNGYKAWTVYLGIPHPVVEGFISAPNCTEEGVTGWVTEESVCGCGYQITEEITVKKYESKHKITADTEYADSTTYAVTIAAPLGHDYGVEAPERIDWIYVDNNYFANAKNKHSCTACGVDYLGKDIENSALFAKKGTTVSEYGQDAIGHVIFANLEAIAAYNEFLGEGNEIKYGVVAGLATEDGKPVNSDGSVNGRSFAFEFSGTEFSIIQIKLTGITNEEQGLYCCSYIIVGGEVMYIHNETVKSTATTVSLANPNGIEAAEENINIEAVIDNKEKIYA